MASIRSDCAYLILGEATNCMGIPAIYLDVYALLLKGTLEEAIISAMGHITRIVL
jgi:hypothetical protein